jgi:hypothetical protein
MKSILKSVSVLALASSVAWAAEPLRLQWGTIDTASDASQAESRALRATVARKAAAARRAAAPETRAAYVVQFPSPVLEEWRTWLESATQVRGYLPEFAYLVWATPSEMLAVAANENVFWTGEWKPEYKTVRAGSAPAARSASGDTPARWMHVGSLRAGNDGAADLRDRLEALEATVRSSFPRLGGCGAVALLADAQIAAVADWPDIEWIEPQPTPVLFNDQAARTNMMNVSNAWKSLSSGGLGLTGAGQIVAVADTGCDTGDLADLHPDLAGRIVAAYGWTNDVCESGAPWADLQSHGTHVCGSILGSGAKSSGQYKGMAHEARLVMQGCWETLCGLPSGHLQDLFGQAYDAGARIHSDSWGYGPDTSGYYVWGAVDADDYMWTNQNFLILFAAGNYGCDTNSDGITDPGSVGPPGTAKNVLCVGAAENWRSSGGRSTLTYGGKWPSEYPADPIANDKISGTAPQGLGAFSSRGPTLDGRIKPDIVAPGTDIVSVRSRAASGTGWGVVAANTNYLYMGGTSMATPLTAGATALVRQWLVDRQGIAEPPAALMKALLINGARDMTPGQYGTNQYQEITARPDRSQGFGHVDLCNALDPGDGNFLVFATNTIAATHDDFTTNLVVGAANAGTYVLTLAWQDYPGKPEAEKELVNDLDLIVTDPSGNVVAYPNGLSDCDRLNNVEFLEFTAAETGTYTVKVHGENIVWADPHGGQPFALVMRGPKTVIVDEAPVFAIASATETALVDDEFYYDFTPLFSVRGYPEPSFAITSSLPDGAWGVAGSKIAFTPSATGIVTFACTASNTVGASVCTLTVAVVRPVPAAPVWSPFPTPLISEDGFFDFIPGDYLFPGYPVPGIELTSPAAAADPGDYHFEDGQFAFDPSSGPGSYPFVFTASNTAGAADATLLVTVVSEDYTAWLTANILPVDTAPADTAPNDHTYSENYVADVPPSDPFLEVTFTSATNGTLSIVPFSSNRTYQLLYWTDILSDPVTNDLTPTNLTFPTDATGFGRIRVTLPAPPPPSPPPLFSLFSFPFSLRRPAPLPSRPSLAGRSPCRPLSSLSSFFIRHSSFSLVSRHFSSRHPVKRSTLPPHFSLPFPPPSLL